MIIKPVVIRALLLFIALSVQLSVWYVIRDVKPRLIVVPPVPSKTEVALFSLGDKEWYFRTLAFTLQNAGDSFGRFTPLKDYDYALLYQWFLLLDTLDARSDFVPSIASYYYSQTQNKSDVKYIVRYLEQHAARNPEKKWWWLAQAVYLAKHVLNDKQWALSLAKKLSHVNADMPAWARQMPALVYAELGEKEAALVIIKGLLEHPERFSPAELRYMKFFIDKRLDDLIKASKGQ
jgi:hypothetical protein